MSDEDDKPAKVVRDANGRVISGNMNPGGRPKLKAHFRYRCREIVDEHVIDAWREEVVNRGEYWIKASALLAAYGYGMPKQEMKLDDNRPPTRELTVDELRELARRQLSSEQRDDGNEPPQH